MGHLTSNASKETLQMKGKTLTKQEAIFTDNTVSIRVVLWEKDIPKVTTGSCHSSKKIAFKEYGETKYLTLTRHRTIESIQINIDQQDTSDVKTETTQHQFPPDGVNLCATIPHMQQVPVKTCKQYIKDHQMLRMWPYPTEAKVPKLIKNPLPTLFLMTICINCSTSTESKTQKLKQHLRK